MNSSFLKSINSFSAISLVIANIFPLFAVLFMGWDVYTVLFLYVVETAVIGVYGIFKLIIVSKFWSIFVIPLFAFAYGMTLMVPFAIVAAISDSHFKGLKDTSAFFSDVKSGVIAYLISHGISFIFNYIGKKEYKGMTVENQMAASFQRIGLIFVSVLIGFFFYIMKETPLQFILFITVMFVLPISIIHLVKRIKGKKNALAMAPKPAKPKMTLKKKLAISGAVVIFGVLLIAPQITILIFVIVAKTGVDLYSHLSEHKPNFRKEV